MEIRLPRRHQCPPRGCWGGVPLTAPTAGTGGRPTSTSSTRASSPRAPCRAPSPGAHTQAAPPAAPDSAGFPARLRQLLGLPRPARARCQRIARWDSPLPRFPPTLSSAPHRAPPLVFSSDSRWQIPDGQKTQRGAHAHAHLLGFAVARTVFGPLKKAQHTSTWATYRNNSTQAQQHLARRCGPSREAKQR